MRTPECFLCSSKAGITIMQVEDVGMADIVPVCDVCYATACYGQDQGVAHLWRAVKQAHSSGYTHAGFASLIQAEASRLGGEVAVAWLRAESRVPSGKAVKVDAPYLAVGLPLRPGLSGEAGLVFDLTSRPMPPAMAEACAKRFRTLDAPGRSFFSFPGSKPEAAHPAILASFRHSWDAESAVHSVAHEGGSAGYELIRRWLI